MPMGIALSGGGTKGCFEVGALRAMYNRGIRPSIIAGTSVGALNAVKLAEDPTSDDALSHLENIWLGLVTESDMYIEEPHFAEVDSSIKALLRYNWFKFGFDVVTLPAGNLFAGTLSILVDLAPVAVTVATFFDGIQAFVQANAKSLYLLDPIRQKLADNVSPQKVAASGVKLRIAMVSYQSGKTRFVNEKAKFTDDGSSVDLIQAAIASASIPGIFPPQNLGPESFIDGGVRDMVPIQAALDAGADQVFACVASRSGVDPLPTFDKETIWDIARRATVDIMPDQIQEAQVHPEGQGWASNVTFIQADFAVHDALTIDPGLIRINYDFGYMRAAEMVDFSSSNDPAIFVKLAMLVSLSKSIATLRKQIWFSEFGAAGQRTLEQAVIDPEVRLVPSPQAFLEVRNLKVQLKSLLEERVQLYGTTPKIKVSPDPLDFGTVPICAPQIQFLTVSNTSDAGMSPNFQNLWLQFEAHPWINPAASSPWSDFVSRAGNAPAAPPPAPTISIQDLQLGTCVSSDPSFTVMTPNGTTVPVGQSISIAIQFAPTAAGLTKATLTVPSNDPANPAVQIQLLGQGTNPPAEISVSPTKVNFGKVSVDSDAKHLIRIANVGCGPLNITALTVTESDKAGVFSVSSSPLPITIAPGTATMVTVDFGPVGNTGYAGTLDIESNAQAASVTLEGQGFGRTGGG